MHLRCPDCHAGAWVETEPGGKLAEGATCKGCGTRFELRSHGSAQQFFASVKQLAADKEIDVPGACSVLLGLMKVDQVRDLTGTPLVCVDETPPDVDVHKFKYDRAFLPAVEAGSLTPQLAMQRGKREAFAALVASRHRLSIETAYEIADNRISLLEAIRRREREGSVHVGSFRSAGPPRLLPAMAALSLVVLSAVLVLGLASINNDDDRFWTTVGTTNVRVNEEKRVVMVEGPDPADVLNAYCESLEDLESIGLMISARKAPRTRVGILKNRNAGEDLLAISIHQDPASRRWIAGNGDAPLLASRAPANAGASLETR